MISLIANQLPNGHTITAKAEEILQTDPHGFTLTVIAISAVFIGLLILCFIYNVSGNIFTGKYKQAREEKKKMKAAKKASGKAEDEVAAAISMALRLNGGDEVSAAVATALYLHLSGGSHDGGPFVITFNPGAGAWGNKMLNLRKQR